jgi:hypothetical protein
MVCRRRRSWYVIRAFYFKAIYTVVEQKLKLEAGFFFFFQITSQSAVNFLGKKELRKTTCKLILKEKH